jgi:hypothetical protein
MLANVFLRHAVVTRSIFVFFRRFDLHINGFHPDRCGGLAFLGNFSLRFSYLIAAVALNSVHALITSVYMHESFYKDPGSLLATIAFILVAPVAFFLPLIPPHKHMERARGTARGLITRRAEAVYAKIQEGLVSGSELSKTDTGTLEELQKLAKLVDDFPVWPLDVGTLRRFVGTVMSPFVIAILTDAFKKWFLAALHLNING